MKKGYDFSGWVTKHDVVCTDGVTIMQGAFSGNEGKKVPLVWQHNYSTNENVLGHIILHATKQGVYGYGYLNNTNKGQDAKEQLIHGDLNSMSIGAKNIKREQPGNKVIHGDIYEVSLVMAPANSGAVIDNVLTHDDTEDDKIIVYTGNRLLMSEDLPDGDDIIKHVDEKDKEGEMPEDNIEDVLESLTDKQKEAVAELISNVLENPTAFDDEIPVDDEEDKEVEVKEDKEVEHEEDLEGESILKHNIFNAEGQTQNNSTLLHTASGEVITHSDFNDVISAAAKQKVTSLNNFAGSVLEQAEVVASDELLQHSITNIEVLFPNTKTINTAEPYNPDGQNVEAILAGFYRSPFSRIKNVQMNLTEADARARGYIKGNQKLDSITSVFFRETTPTTVIRREKFNRDDLIDIQENGIDTIQFVANTQRVKLAEELVRAAFIGDGRPAEVNGEVNPDHINPNHIRPIISDDPLFTMKLNVNTWKESIDKVIVAMAAYAGSGSPTLFINPFDLAGIKTLKDSTGRYLFGASQISNSVPTDDSIAAYFGCSKVLTYRPMTRGTFIIGNLKDYAFGAAKGGQIENFEDFDIDFNQMKYLTETRLSGAIQAAKSFLVVNVKDPEKFGELTITNAETEALGKFDTTGLKTDPTWVTDSNKKAAASTGGTTPEGGE